MRIKIKTKNGEINYMISMIEVMETEGTDTELMQRLIAKINTMRHAASVSTERIQMLCDDDYKDVTYEECCDALLVCAGEVLERIEEYK